MTGMHFWIVGMVGAGAVESLQFYGAARHARRWPWRGRDRPDEARFTPLLLSVVIRLFAGGLLAWAAGMSHQIAGVFGATLTGMAAPLFIQQVAVLVPLEPLALRVDPLVEQAPALPEGGEQDDAR